MIVHASDIGLLSRDGIWMLDSTGVYYKYGISGGAWVGPLGSSSNPGGRNFGNMNLGNTVAIYGDGAYHLFRVTGNPGAWTDSSQSASLGTTAARNMADIARFDTALYIAGETDDMFHKFTSVGGVWTDSAQGYLLPF